MFDVRVNAGNGDHEVYEVYATETVNYVSKEVSGREQPLVFVEVHPKNGLPERLGKSTLFPLSRVISITERS
jgi:hypothetical protein